MPIMMKLTDETGSLDALDFLATTLGDPVSPFILLGEEAYLPQHNQVVLGVNPLHIADMADGLREGYRPFVSAIKSEALSLAFGHRLGMRIPMAEQSVELTSGQIGLALRVGGGFDLVLKGVEPTGARDILYEHSADPGYPAWLLENYAQLATGCRYRIGRMSRSDREELCLRALEGTQAYQAREGHRSERLGYLAGLVRHSLLEIPRDQAELPVRLEIGQMAFVQSAGAGNHQMVVQRIG